MTNEAVRELAARHDVARRVIGDLSIEKAAMAEAIAVRDARIAELEETVDDLERFIAELRSAEEGGDTDG
ncbi:MAG TPA: hypothetical protein VJP45_08230 [Candidatus Limnocylindria bacterium]|nr:hypothetical protein [Candidatus Limnocylindria bacterium]